MEDSEYSVNQRKKTQEDSTFLKILKFILLIIIIAWGLLFIINTIKGPDITEKENPVPVISNLVDPDTVTEQQKLDGFTTERIFNHFNNLIDEYFPDEKDYFKDWKIQYKKNEEWNSITWTKVDGEEAVGHFEGICDYDAKTIYLNDDYFPRYDSHDDVILHEMIHVICTTSGHQTEFMEICERIADKSPFSKEDIYGYSGWGSVE